MKKILAAVCLSLVAACGSSNKPAAAPPDPRPAARAAVDVAKDAWVVAANACIAAVQAGARETVQAICSKDLDPAHDLIVVASNAVGATWNAGAACDLANAGKLLVEVANTLGSKDVAAVVNDAAVVATGLAGGCQSDGG